MLLSMGLAAAVLISLSIGYLHIPPLTLLRALIGHGPQEWVIIAQEIRLPRAVLGAAIGGALGLGGAALQGLFRNPLAEPGILGVSSSAGLGAITMFYFGLAHHFPLAVSLAAMSVALLATAILLLLARQIQTLGLVLAGVALNSFMTAMTMLAVSLAPNPLALSEIVYWLMGSVRDKSLTDVSMALPFIVAGGALIFTAGRGLDAVTLGEDVAESLGISIQSLRQRIVIGIALSVGASVAAAGSIGFVGLIVPHLLRPFVAHRPSALLLPSALGGALLLTLADIGVRLFQPGPELMLGVVTAFIGAPFFFGLVIRREDQ